MDHSRIPPATFKYNNAVKGLQDFEDQLRKYLGLDRMLFHEELFTRSQCTCCQQEISGLGIECLECHGGNFRLCCECFSFGAEIGQHKVEHSYRYFDSGSLILSLKVNPKNNEGIPTPTLNNSSPESVEQGPKWSAREEIRLLDAIEQYGFGNWQDISKHIETKPPAEAKSEYVNRYVVGTLGELTWSTGIPNEVNKNICNNTHVARAIDHTLPRDEGPLSPSLTSRLPPLEIGVEEMLQLGYMPNRDDYEKEYDNEAEKLVSQLSFTSEDDEADIGLKLALVDMYTRRLRERAKRKRMIRDYQLVAKFFKKDKVRANGISVTASVENGLKDTPSKGPFASYERNLQEKLRPFAQFHTCRENDNLVRNMVKEKDLIQRLGELFKYRRNGIKRLDECTDFERLKGNGSVVPLRGKRNLDTILESENQEGRSGTKKGILAGKLAAPLLIQQLQQAIPPNSPKAKSIITTSNNGNGESAGGSPSAARNLIPQPSFRDDSNSKSFMESSELARASLPQVREGNQPMGAEAMVLLTTANSSQQKEKLKGLADLFIVDIIPSADLLTDKELQFCTKTRVTPAQYLTIKTALLLARKPKIDTHQIMEIQDIPCPPNINIQPNEWEQVVKFFKSTCY